MSVTIPASDLSRLVRQVAPACERSRKNTIPILGGICIEAGGGRIRARATDTETCLYAEAEADTNGTRIAHVMTGARALPRVLRAAGAQPVRLGIDTSGGGEPLTIATDDIDITMVTLPAADLPDLPPPVTDGNASLTATLGEEALTAIARVAPAMSREETRFYLNGVYLHRGVGPWGWTVVATDGVRIMMADVQLPDAVGDLPGGAIIPRRAVELLLRHRPRTQPLTLRLGARPPAEGKRREAAQPDMIEVASADGWMLRAHLVDVTYPNYQRVLPDGSGMVATVDRAHLLRALRVAAGLETTRERSLAMRLEFGGGRLTLAATTLGRDSIRQSMPIEGATKITIGVNALYLAEALAAFAPTETVSLTLTDNASPILLRAGDVPGLTAAVMPMRM